MTDTPDTVTGVQTPDPDAQADHDDDHGTGPQDDHVAGHDDVYGDPARKARRENAGLRKRLRDTEAERDQLRERIDAMLARRITDAVQAAGYPTKLAELITDMDTLLDDDGALDTNKLNDAITSAAAEYNITRKGRPPEPSFQQGRHGGGQHRQPDSDWKAAFAPPRR